MATIYKRTKKKGEPYSIQWFDHEGKRRACKGFTDKGLSEQLAAKLEEEARLRRTGMIDPVQEKFMGQKRLPITDHLDAFERSLAKNSTKHVMLTMSRVRRVADECGFETIAEISVEAVEIVLTEMLEDEEIGHRTYNHYVQAFDSFCNWMVDTKRLIANPLVGMERLNPAVDVRHKRRALSPEEVGKLVTSARESGVSIQCFTGEERARIYILSFLTGLRRKEIASLTPRSFDLDADTPKLTVEAACSKHRREDVLPLHPALVKMLREWLKGLPPDELLFPRLAKRRTWLMVKKDLERVGIPYENADGIADFHAAGRHSHITGLVRHGASIVEAKELARHTDVRMTMKYTHVGIEDQAKAVAALPSLHIRCISGVSEGLPVSPAVARLEAKKHQNPGGDRGYGVDRHSASLSVSVEAAGIEPASRDIFTKASTCVAEGLIVDRRGVTQRDFLPAYSGTC